LRVDYSNMTLMASDLVRRLDHNLAVRHDGPHTV